MKTLIVHAHPEPQSLAASLRDIAVAELRAQGHDVEISDLYAEGFKAQVDRADFPNLPAGKRLKVPASSGAVGERSERRWGDRYGEGVLAGRRAMVIVTTGGWAEHYGPRGVNGPIDDILFPINHGILYYPGFEVLPAHVEYRADRIDEAAFAAAAIRLRERMRQLPETAPIPFRQQNGGDCHIPSTELFPGLESEGTNGFGLHVQANSNDDAAGL